MRMPLHKKLFLLCIPVFFFTAAHAQIEVAHLQSKNFNATGFGGFLNFAIPLTDADAVTIEGGLYYFSNNGYHEAVAPVLVGYRHLFSDYDYGFYAEPFAGYSFGATDIQKLDANGNALYKPNGNELDQKVTGATAGLGFGYLFQQSGPIRFNIGLRYEHVFVSGDPVLNIFSLRISHSFSFGRRD
jgi:hypothetical protein